MPAKAEAKGVRCSIIGCSDDRRGRLIPLAAYGPVSPAEAAFAALDSAFQKVEAAGDLFERSFLLAGKTVRLRVAGQELGECLCVPLAHLPAAPGDGRAPDLTVLAIDRSGFPAPRPAMPDPACPGAPGVSAQRDILASPDGRFVCEFDVQSGSVWCLDRKTAQVVGAADSAGELALRDKGRPLQPLMAFWLDQGRIQPLHAGLVARNGQGVMLAGGGGAGKSTAALCCLTGGFDFLGDDYIVLESAEDGSFTGHSLYSSAFLDPEHLTRFSGLASHAVRGRYAEEDKHLLLLSKLFAGRLPARVPIRYVLLPRVRAGGQARLAVATRGEALRRLVPSCLLRGPRLGREGFNVLVKLVERVECRWLDLGADLEAVPRVVENLLGA